MNTIRLFSWLGDYTRYPAKLTLLKLYFAIDSLCSMRYIQAAQTGRSTPVVENPVDGNWQLAPSNT